MVLVQKRGRKVVTSVRISTPAHNLLRRIAAQHGESITHTTTALLREWMTLNPEPAPDRLPAETLAQLIDWASTPGGQDSFDAYVALLDHAGWPITLMLARALPLVTAEGMWESLLHGRDLMAHNWVGLTDLPPIPERLTGDGIGSWNAPGQWSRLNLALTPEMTDELAVLAGKADVTPSTIIRQVIDEAARTYIAGLMPV